MRAWLSKTSDPSLSFAIAARSADDSALYESEADGLFSAARIAQAIDTLEAKAPPADQVFAHNGLGATALAEERASGAIKLVQLEQCAPNFAAFDIADHFIEWGGGHAARWAEWCELTNAATELLGVPAYDHLPTDEQKRAFVTAYVGERDGAADGAVVDAMLDDVAFFGAVSDVYWGLWALSEARDDAGSGFPYLPYAASRLSRGLGACGAIELGIPVPSLGATKKDAAGAIALYDEWAPMYDASLLSWGYTAHTRCAALLSSLLVGPAALRVLDTGCGTGLSGEALHAAGFAPSAGIDISSASLDYIRKTKPGVYDALEVVDLDQLSSAPLPFVDDSFGGVVCVGVLSYVADYAGLFTEWARVTRPGGVIVFTHRNQPWQQGGAKPAAAALEAHGTWARVHESACQPYMPRNPDYKERAKRIRFVAFRVL